MKTIASIALGLVVLFASLAFLMSSLCAVSGGLNSGGGRAAFALVAAISLGIAIGSVMLIGKINRRS